MIIQEHMQTPSVRELKVEMTTQAYQLSPKIHARADSDLASKQSAPQNDFSVKNDPQICKLTQKLRDLKQNEQNQGLRSK